MEKIEKTDMIEKKDKFTIRNHDLYYGDFHALKGINLNISPNEITAFIGPSG